MISILTASEESFQKLYADSFLPVMTRFITLLFNGDVEQQKEISFGVLYDCVYRCVMMAKEDQLLDNVQNEIYSAMDLWSSQLEKTRSSEEFVCELATLLVRLSGAMESLNAVFTYMTRMRGVKTVEISCRNIFCECIVNKFRNHIQEALQAVTATSPAYESREICIKTLPSLDFKFVEIVNPSDVVNSSDVQQLCSKRKRAIGETSPDDKEVKRFHMDLDA